MGGLIMMDDDSWIVEKINLRTSQQNCVATTNWLNWSKIKWEGRQGEGQILRGLQFVHSFSSIQANI
jgi:hypothetical protein